MKALRLLPALLVINFSLRGQTNIEFILKKPPSLKVDTVDASDLSQKEFFFYDFRDTLNMRFNKSNIDCYNIRFHENGKVHRKLIWLDTGNIKIQGHIERDELIIDTVLNSPIFYVVKHFDEEYDMLQKTNDTTALNDYLLTNYEQNIQNPFSLMIGNYYVKLNQNSKSDLLEFKFCADKQGDRFNSFILYPIVFDRLNKILEIDKINVGDFTFINKEDDKVNLHLEGSDYYVLDFWFLTCPPCISDHKEIKLNYEKLKKKRVEVISISTHDNFLQWKNYLSSHNYNWQNYLQTTDGTITDRLSITGYPTYIILTNDGKILITYNSFADVERKFKIGE